MGQRFRPIDPNDPTPEVIGARIKAERQRLHLTQTQVATVIGQAADSYRQLERRANPTVATLFGLRRAGITIGAILPELLKPYSALPRGE